LRKWDWFLLKFGSDQLSFPSFGISNCVQRRGQNSHTIFAPESELQGKMFFREFPDKGCKLGGFELPSA